ncbi:MAG: ATP synthase F0 subunit B, partial [Raoultibacter sp.]
MKAINEAKKVAAKISMMTLAALGASFVFPASAFASEEGSGGISAILPDMAEFIPMLAAFIILWIVLAKFGWPLFAGMLDKREATIKESLEKAEEARVESERVLGEYKTQLEEARSQAAKIVASANATGESVKADIT